MNEAMLNEDAGLETEAAGELFDVIDRQLAFAAQDFGTEFAISKNPAEVGCGHLMCVQKRLEGLDGGGFGNHEGIVLGVVGGNERGEDVEIVGLISGEVVVVESHGVEDFGGIVRIDTIMDGAQRKAGDELPVGRREVLECESVRLVDGHRVSFHAFLSYSAWVRK